MNFANPHLLWLLCLLLPFGWLGWLARRRRARTAGLIGSPALVAQLYSVSVQSWRRRRFILSLLIFSLIAFSAARPQYGRIEQVVRRSGVDVLIALDTSRSMLAQDVRPSRLEKAKESLKWLLRRLKGNRVGIIAFAGESFLNCPMTLDFSLADLVLESLDTNSVGVPGTDLGKAIRAAKGAFERGGSGRPALVLITDGEDNEGEGLAAAKEAASSGLVIYAIGIGTESGAPVPNENNQGYKQTAEGTKVNSKLDMTGLAAIAQATGGAAYAAEDSPMAAIEAVARNINGLEKAELESKRLVIYQDRFSWFLAPAVICLIWLLISQPERAVEARTIPVNNAASAGSK
ncbi:VWA domain-containing protein [Candidatus Sumerlaeota bacterium]|nr:VWA domain-containing protein [Candidatus Sumerlaeota bacterium]